MKLTALGHIAFLLEAVAPATGQPVRILGDPWLSDYAIGDRMGRFPRVRFDAAALAPLDAIFLSHSHTDHLDPYTLVRLWRELPSRPALLLPESLSFLIPLLREFLARVEVVLLRHMEEIEFRGVKLRAFFNPEREPTNEDDVMVLIVDAGRTVLLNECDALLPFYDAEFRASLAEKLFKPEVETVIFLTAKNELEATMSSLSAASPEDRLERLSRSLERTQEEIEEIFIAEDGATDDGDDEESEEDGARAPDLWRDPRIVRLIGGQGMCYPQAIRPEWNRVLFPIDLETRAVMERDFVLGLDGSTSIEPFAPGREYETGAGGVLLERSAEWLRLLDKKDDRRFDPAVDIVDDHPVAPLRDEERDEAKQAHLILSLLDERFRPWLIGARRPPVEHLLGERGGSYRVRVRYGTTTRHRDRDYVLTFARMRFTEHSVEESEQAPPDEHYWANDLEDFAAGECDEFSIFCRRPLSAPARRFWSMLGLPYLNEDLVERKLRLHFERASRGKSLEDWVLRAYRR